jgi:2-amino-4-hydroxy-6-hydroxymethyldihydropteridine diphosphokinase
MQHRAYIGLGANLPSRTGDPEQTLRAAVADLAAAGKVLACSSIYRTEPMDYIDQPAFANAVIALETELEPERLLDSLLETERRYGRDRNADVPKGPRILDLDLLLWDDRVQNTPQLTLPHPALAGRRFVLAPLAEIAPDLRHPVLDKTIRELLNCLEDKGANRPEAVVKL